MRESVALESEIVSPPISVQANVRYRMDVTFQCTITPFVARQNTNVYLLMNVGNMFSAGEPILFLGTQPHWKVPVFCAFPEFNRREKIGELAVDMNSGAILPELSYPSSPQAMDRHAEIIYDSLATPSTGA